jgi:hypothetical protein
MLAEGGWMSIESAIQGVVDATHSNFSNAVNGVAVFEAGELEKALREFAMEILRSAEVAVKDALQNAG